MHTHSVPRNESVCSEASTCDRARQSNWANSALVDPRELFLSGSPPRQPKVFRYKYVSTLYRNSYKYVLFCVGRGRSVECCWGADTHLVPRHETLRSEIDTCVLARESKRAKSVLVASAEPRESFLVEWSGQLSPVPSCDRQPKVVSNNCVFCTEKGRVTGVFTPISYNEIKCNILRCVPVSLRAGQSMPIPG